ncbi:MAG: PilZ domain-containing protein [Deltaproteobacteria bacterium]|nr:PilZ domain-containing protein [Deltaproteobacteria bacterium]
MLDTSISRFRRVGPRVPIYAFCSEFSGDQARHAIAVDLSEGGFRLQRPEGYSAHRRLQVELELPDLDEVIWVDGEVRHEWIEELAASPAGLSGAVRTSGIRIVGIAESQRRLLRDYVNFLRNEAGICRDTEWCSHLPGVSAGRS